MSSPGIIIPPPDIQNLADRTAKLFAERGKEIEDLVNTNLKDDPKFSFLKFNDPYRPYFDQMVKEYKTGPPDGELQGEEDPIAGREKHASKAPPESRFVYDCGSIGVLENDMIQHTAQFVAKNGQKFLIALTEREKNNGQFDFLKPTHNMFPYFTSLIDSYIRILELDEKDVDELQRYILDKRSILSACSSIFEYESEAQMSRRRREELEEEERAQRAMIDWNDFVVVQTLDFDDDARSYPAPVDLANKERTDHMQFNKANINPDYAFMYDASQAFVGGGRKQKPEGGKVEKEEAREEGAIGEPRKGEKRDTRFDEITVNLRVQNLPAFGDLAGKSFSLQLNPAMSILSVMGVISKKLKGIPQECKLRSPEHDVLSDVQTLGEYGAYNGVVLELIR